MIVVRNVFRLKFGMAREGVAAWKEGLGIAERAGLARGTARLLTDMAGPDFYTLVVEMSHDSLGDMERSARTLMDNADWKKWYPRFSALAEGGHREIFSVVE
ncbi:MAG: hypothetical protein ACREL3_07690 [Gemmatimonadales bacterium]